MCKATDSEKFNLVLDLVQKSKEMIWDISNENISLEAQKQIDLTELIEFTYSQCVGELVREDLPEEVILDEDNPETMELIRFTEHLVAEIEIEVPEPSSVAILLNLMNKLANYHDSTTN